MPIGEITAMSFWTPSSAPLLIVTVREEGDDSLAITCAMTDSGG
jgi:hypothetical protein